MDDDMIRRLQTKMPTEAIIERLQHDFNLAPIMARALFEQMGVYFERYYEQKRDTGQITCLVVSTSSPAGRRLEECERVAVTLSLDTADDLQAMHDSLATLRRQRILRLTEEAYEQKALLTHEDLARLLCTSLATIKRDVKQLRTQGLHVPTRGQIKDIGKGVSHKTQIVQDYLAGYTFTELERRRRHSISSIKRYCQDFVRIARLSSNGLKVDEIRRCIGLSERLINEYLTLYQQTDASNERLQLLLAQPNPATAEPAEIKRGVLLP